MSLPIISINELKNIIDLFEKATQAHTAWLIEWHRAIINKVPLEQQYMADDAYRHCSFGKWYYDNNSYIASFPLFGQIELLHITIHLIARNLLLKSINGEQLSLVEYDKFLRFREEFRELLRVLEKDLQQTLFYTDPLTLAPNRQNILPFLYRRIKILEDYQENSVICILSVDYFKKIKDTYGHHASDQVLVEVVGFLSKHLRRNDKIFRYGEEEFLLVLVNSNLADSGNVIERLRILLAEKTISINDNTSLQVTGSFGLAALMLGLEVEESISSAEQALCAAKTNGCNQVCCATSLVIEYVNHLTDSHAAKCCDTTEIAAYTFSDKVTVLD